MSNWALLQEQLTGLPVAKRAKYGIHFQKGSEIEAHFVGKPCHYQEGGIWKPIDTALLATADGWFSSPHSDVVIHPDGRVRVKGSTYQQFTELPSAKTGKLVGDKIIREFPGGEQHLIMTEDGFREEIHVFKPKFPLEKFIAKTAGNLPSKYKAHPITAEDAEGNGYTFTGDVAEFGAWLDKAVCPVVIDPDISITTGVGADSPFNSIVPNNNYGGIAYLRIGAAGRRSLIRFDLSSISAGSTCTAAAMKVTNYQDVPAEMNFYLYEIASANGDWIEGTSTGGAQNGSPCWNYKAYNTTAWAGSAGLSTAGTDYVNTALAEKTLTTASKNTNLVEMTINASGLSVLSGWFGDASNAGLLFISDHATQYHIFHSKESATEGYRPVLSVTYAAGGVPKHFMHYQRLRSL